jgi:hypothetical protein
MKPGVLAVICLVVPMLAVAAERRSSFTVTVTVPPRVALTVLSEPASIDVTAEDLQAGYKDVVARYAVDGNDPRGYVLRVAPRLGLAARIEVSGLAAGAVTLAEQPIDVAKLGAADGMLDLRYRIVFESGSAPGRYALPLELAALPLEAG